MTAEIPAKKPWMKFYPADWRADPQLRMCGLAARGLWAEMLCLMHEADPYGYLTVNGRPVTDAQLAILCGITPAEVTALLSELEDAGVFSRAARGSTIYCRRMIRDEQKRKDGERSAKTGALPGSRRSRKAVETKQKNSPPPAEEAAICGGVAVQPPPTQRPEPISQKLESRVERLQPGSQIALPSRAAASTPLDGVATVRVWPDAVDLVAAFDDARADCWGEEMRRPWPAATDAPTAAAALKRGAELELPGAETLSLCTGLFRQRMASMQAKGQTPPQTLRFFEQAIADMLAAAVAPLPSARPVSGGWGQSGNGKYLTGADADRVILQTLGLLPDD